MKRAFLLLTLLFIASTSEGVRLSSAPVNYAALQYAGYADERNELTPLGGHAIGPLLDRTIPLFINYWPVLVYIKWAATRKLLSHLAAKLGVDSVVRLLSNALFPLGVDRFILFRALGPLLSKVGTFVFQWLYNSLLFFFVFMTALG